MKVLGPCLGVTVVLSLMAPTVVLAQADENEDQARETFLEAEDAFAAHRYETATNLFQEAYALMQGDPRQYMLRFNIARSQEQSGSYAEAIASYELYLDEGGDDVQNRGEVESSIAELRQRLDEEADEGTATGTAEDAEAGSGGLMVGSLVAFGVGAIAAGFTVGFGAAALSANDSLATGCGATGSCSSGEVDSANGLALAADVSLGIAIAAGITGLALLIVHLLANDDEETASARSLALGGVF